MNDAGGGNTLSGLNISIDDAFPDVPLGTSGDRLSRFDGTNLRGSWSLYAVDDTNGDDGAFSRGWGLQITATVMR